MAGTGSRRVLLVESDEHTRERVKSCLVQAGYEVIAPEPAQALSSLEQERYDLVLISTAVPGLEPQQLLRRVKARSPRTPVVVMSTSEGLDEAMEAVRQGASDFLLKPLVPEVLKELAARLAPATGPARPRPSRRIVTQDPRMLKLLEMARAVANSRATVLIMGESGTGKELFARFIHDSSSRAKGPFVAVNCAALPEGLLESELFGHEKGAFTGAIARKPGKFELADGGTILLDEVSEMPVGLQAKLLRVLQEGEVDRVGGRRPVPVDVRVVATTNRDLKEEMKKGNFREDLYYRLNVIPLKIPPLRERKGDILLLANHFLKLFGAEAGKGPMRMTPQVQQMLLAHPWPGNVRELMNTIQRAVLLSPGDEIVPEALMFDDQPPPPAPSESPGAQWLTSGPIPTLKEAERLLIMRALEQTDGNRTHAAKVLGISVRTLRNKLNEYKQAHGLEIA